MNEWLNAYQSLFLVITTREAKSFAGNVYVCLPVRNMITYESLNVESLFLVRVYNLSEYSSGWYMKMCWVEIKVTGAKKYDYLSSRSVQFWSLITMVIIIIIIYLFFYTLSVKIPRIINKVKSKTKSWSGHSSSLEKLLWSKMWRLMWRYAKTLQGHGTQLK